jgi:predicted Co/Zn/Cd cation transporter (cation efflux family)
VSRRGPSEDYPWGREAWEPIVVIVKALALGVLCLYAAVGAVQDLLAGGREVATGWALLYAVLATAVGIVVTLVLRRGGRSDLVRAEAAEWQGDTLLSVGVLVGFAIAEALVVAGRPDLAAYIDPAMVVAVSVMFLWVPGRLVTGALREILSMAPPAAMREELKARVDAVAQRFGLSEAFVRAAKVGRRLDIEIDFVVGADSLVQTVADCDKVREHLHDRLAGLGDERSVVVAFTADRKWAL